MAQFRLLPTVENRHLNQSGHGPPLPIFKIALNIISHRFRVI